MKLHCRVVTKMIEANGHKFPSYYCIYAKSDKKSVGYMDITFARTTKAFYDAHTTAKKSSYLDLELRLGDKNDSTKNAFLAFKQKKGDDGKYHDILNKNHERIPKIVILDLKETDIIPNLELPSKRHEELNPEEYFKGIDEEDNNLPF